MTLFKSKTYYKKPKGNSNRAYSPRGFGIANFTALLCVTAEMMGLTVNVVKKGLTLSPQRKKRPVSLKFLQQQQDRGAADHLLLTLHSSRGVGSRSLCFDKVLALRLKLFPHGLQRTCTLQRLFERVRVRSIGRVYKNKCVRLDVF